MATAPAAVHSPAAIERAKSKALAALAAVNEPQPVPGGLSLCAEMRLWRATETLAATDRTDAKYPTIALATGQLADRAEALDEAARAACVEYRRLCSAANQQPDPLRSESCTCDGHQMIAAMESARRAALWLLWPLAENRERYPALAVLWKAGKREDLAEKIETLANAQVAYTDACAKLGTQPQWGWLLR